MGDQSSMLKNVAIYEMSQIIDTLVFFKNITEGLLYHQSMHTWVLTPPSTTWAHC